MHQASCRRPPGSLPSPVGAHARMRSTSSAHPSRLMSRSVAPRVHEGREGSGVRARFEGPPVRTPAGTTPERTRDNPRALPRRSAPFEQGGLEAWDLRAAALPGRSRRSVRTVQASSGLEARFLRRHGRPGQDSGRARCEDGPRGKESSVPSRDALFVVAGDSGRKATEQDLRCVEGSLQAREDTTSPRTRAAAVLEGGRRTARASFARGGPLDRPRVGSMSRGPRAHSGSARAVRPTPISGAPARRRRMSRRRSAG